MNTFEPENILQALIMVKSPKVMAIKIIEKIPVIIKK